MRKKYLDFLLVLIILFMAVLNWGDLTKSQEDGETIEEAIARLIAVHNADEESHLAEGQSLESHKASEVIDHLAGSVIEDKIGDQEVSNEKFKFNQFKLESYFESIDAWTSGVGGTASLTEGLASLLLSTGTTINSWLRLNGEAWTEGDAVDYLKNPRFITIARTMSVTDQEIYLIAGSWDLDGFGFYIEDGTLYAIHIKDGTEYKTDISSGITVTDWHRYKAIYTSGSKIEFYVDDVLKTTHSTNLPEDGADSADELNFFSYRIQNTATSNKRLILKYCVLQQDT